MNTRLNLIILAMSAIAASGETFSEEPDSDAEQEAVKQLQALMETSCAQNSGSNSTYAELMEAVGHAPACFATKFNVPELIEGGRQLTNDIREAYFTANCATVKKGVQECMEPVETISRLCVAPGAQRVEYPDFPLYILPQLVDLVCEEHGAILFANDRDRVTSCFENYFWYLKQCLKNFVSETNAKPRQDYTEVECRVLQKSRQCVVEKLTACGDSGLIRMFDLAYRPVVEQTQCRNFINLEDISS